MRIQKSDRYYIRSGGMVLAEYENNYLPSVEYIYGPNGMIAQYESGEGYQYLYKDHLGSTRQLEPNVQSLDYYPYGQSYYVAGDATDYQFTGKEYDSNIGLHFFGARYYDPQLGRWHSVDPVDEWQSPYLYVKNNPIIAVDPDGEDTWFVHGTWSSLSMAWTETSKKNWQFIMGDQKFNYHLPDWSGCNTQQARLSGAFKIMQNVSRAYSQDNTIPINFVAHSHGGRLLMM